MIGESPGQVPFLAHVELLRLFLTHRQAIVERIQGVLNARRKPAPYLTDRPLLSRHFEDCFFTLADITGDQARLRGQLEQARWASGFRPRQVTELHNDLINPAEMMIRGFHCWRQTRWPGRNSRVRYANMLFDVHLLRSLEFLGLRLWDAGSSDVSDRLAQIQDVLDALWRSSPADLPVLVRDARWLIPLAQSPTTDALGPYFDVARQVSESLGEADRLEVQKASVMMIAGHLRSQLRHYTMKDDLPFDEPSVVRRTRTSNALDFALLIQGLVPLLDAYQKSRDIGSEQRLAFASAICQGISPDPELFLNQVDLLGAYSMIEYLFVTTDDNGQVVYTPMGQRQVRLFDEYATKISRAAKPLLDDCREFRPTPGAYSPYGAIFGTPSNLTEDMALKTLQLDAETRLSLEDVFTDGDGDKLAWVNGWRKLPHIDPAVQALYEYPQRFAEQIFERIERALERCVADREETRATRTGRLFMFTEHDSQRASEASEIADLPMRYIGSSAEQLVDADKAVPYDQQKLLRDRQEGYFLLSYEAPEGWAAIKKDLLTEVLGEGQDVKIRGLPAQAADVLILMCRSLAVESSAPLGDQARAPPSILKA